MSEIGRLIEAVQEAAGSEENRARRARAVPFGFGIEEPIAWHHLFGYDVNRYLSDPGFYVEQTLRQKLWRWHTFPDDGQPIGAEIPAWLGHYPEYTFIGLAVAFDARGVPLIQTDHPLSRDPDLRHLRPVDFHSSGWMPRVLRWHEDLRRIAAGRILVTFNMLWWRGCLDLAIQLRGYENFVADTVERPRFAHDLLGWLTEQRCRWHEAYCRHFGLELGPAAVADDWIHVPFITPAMFADFVLPRYLEIEAFHGGISGIHSCGNQTPVQPDLLRIKSLGGFEVSPWTDLVQTLATIPPDRFIANNLHANDVLCAGEAQMEAKLTFIAGRCRGRRYGVSTSGLTPLSEDTGAFIGRIRTWTALARRILQ